MPYAIIFFYNELYVLQRENVLLFVTKVFSKAKIASVSPNFALGTLSAAFDINNHMP